MVEDRKIQMLNTLPKIDRTKDRMADILEERELSFLFPLVKIQAEMTKQLQLSPRTEDLANWILVNVDSAYHTSHGFISALNDSDIQVHHPGSLTGSDYGATGEISS